MLDKLRFVRRRTVVQLLVVGLMAMSVSSSYAEVDENSVGDPLESMNRVIYRFNDTLDRFLIKPVALGYRYVTYDPIERGVGRMFANIGEIGSIVNGLLQGKVRQAGNDTGRFLVNTTVGLVGFFDVADHLGLEKGEGEDFGQTLGYWGVGSGPYLVLPFFGASNLRDGPSKIVDSFVNPITYIDHVPTRNQVYGVQLVSFRAQLIDAEELISGDEYSFIRDAYLQRREYLVKDGEVEDDFGADDDYY